MFKRIQKQGGYSDASGEIELAWFDVSSISCLFMMERLEVSRFASVACCVPEEKRFVVKGMNLVIFLRK